MGLALLTEDEAAEYLAMAAGTLQLWRRLGIGPPWRKLGTRMVRYEQSELDVWVLSHPVQGETAG